MKIRTDFVTNSSSSSFILGFDSKSSIETELKKAELEKGYYKMLLDDVKHGEVTLEEALTAYKENIRYFVEDDIEDVMAREILEKDPSKMFYNVKYDELDKKEVEKRTNKALEEKAAEVKKKLEKKGYLAIVRYSDHGEAEMEQVIMPRLKNTKAILNEH